MMKTKILSFLVLIGMVLIGTSATAANETDVSIDVAYTYTVSPGNGLWTGSPTYAWAVYESDGTTPATPTTHYTATLGATASNAITWKAAGTYKVTVIATDGNGCHSNPVTITVTVAGENYCTSAATNLETCSLITAGSGNTSDPDQTTFDITINYPKTSGTYVVNYTVGGTAGSANVTSVVAGTTKTATITISHASFTAKFTNTTNADATVAIAVASVMNAAGTPAAVPLASSGCTAVTPYDVTVHPTPVITFE